MSDKDRSREDLEKGHVPAEERGWTPWSGHQPETDELGPPPSGGGGGKEPDSDD